ncbi:signal peptidase II [Aquamicrobium sp. LC103]|uniref:signal peptidase II n=1 Tax=Aquamicrobium sp. LC103 TaxID=1120658 RepID=UPI000ABC40B0|nr:signal peptidase II [Aquamicrobium sp. LC103]TKT82630.1 signal peptidase II [Aquamicrobium sp. LC103]
MTLKSLGIYGGIVALAVLLDQWIKYLVETSLDMHVQVDVIPTLALYRTHNTGIAFSMLSDLGSVGLIVITFAVIALVGYIAWRTGASQRLARLGFALIIGGAIGNLIDRVWHGYVIDYVLFHLPSWSFAIFNLADAFISVGAALVVLEEVLNWRRERAKDAS